MFPHDRDEWLCFLPLHALLHAPLLGGAEPGPIFGYVSFLAVETSDTMLTVHFHFLHFNFCVVYISKGITPKQEIKIPNHILHLQ